MTTSVTVTELFNDLVADLVPYFMNATLLPNSSLIRNSINMVGQTGNAVRFPTTNAYTNAGTVLEEGSIGSASNLDTGPAIVATLIKKGVGSNVSLEALSDGGYDLVYRATLQRLGGGLAQASDLAGFVTAATAFTTEVGTISVADTSTRNVIMSPDALGYAVKDDGPLVETWYDVNTQVHQFRGSIRDAYVAIRPEFGVRMTALNTIGTAFGAIGADISSVALGTTTLRVQNAPTLDNGNYIACIDPAMEYAINEQVALAGGSAAVGSLSDIGNRAFYDGLVGQAVGCAFFRTNNLPAADTVA
tara:strand:- start:145 stop:1056 length:912 start_codon:yes stop_codon:yes gene_type:complete